MLPAPSNDDDDVECDVFLDTRRRKSRDRDRRDRVWLSAGSNQPQKQKAASQNKPCRKGKGGDTLSTTPSHSVAARKNNPSSTLPSNQRSRQNLHTRFSNSSSYDDDGCREYIERLNRKLGMAQTSTQMDDEDHRGGKACSNIDDTPAFGDSVAYRKNNQSLALFSSQRRQNARMQFSISSDDDGCKEYTVRINRRLGLTQNNTQVHDENPTNVISASKSTASPTSATSDRRLPHISQLEEHHDYNGTKRKSDATVDLASTPSKRIRRRSSQEVDRGAYNNHSAIQSAKSSTFEHQNEEYSERLNRGVGRRGRSSRGDGKDDTRRNVSPRKEGAATANAKKSNFRGNHHSPSSLTHSVPSKTKGRQRFDTLTYLRMRHFKDEEGYYPDSENGTKRQSYNDTTIVSRRSTDSVDHWGIAGIRAESPLRFSNTGMFRKEEDIVACDQQFSPENRQATTPKRPPLAKELADRWESPPSSASPLWSFGVKNHKNFSKTGT
jgi:hypothetical protein